MVIDPDLEMKVVTVTSANVSDHETVDDLLAPSADAGRKPIVSAIANAAMDEFYRQRQERVQVAGGGGPAGASAG